MVPTIQKALRPLSPRQLDLSARVTGMDPVEPTPGKTVDAKFVIEDMNFYYGEK